MNAGVWVFGGGLESQKASIVGTDGTVTHGPYPEAVGGFWVVDVSSREEALKWAAKTADACRCAQEVRAFMIGSRRPSARAFRSVPGSRRFCFSSARSERVASAPEREAGVSARLRSSAMSGRSSSSRSTIAPPSARVRAPAG